MAIDPKSERLNADFYYGIHAFCYLEKPKVHACILDRLDFQGVGVKDNTTCGV